MGPRCVVCGDGSGDTRTSIRPGPWFFLGKPVLKGVLSFSLFLLRSSEVVISEVVGNGDDTYEYQNRRLLGTLETVGTRVDYLDVSQKCCCGSGSVLVDWDGSTTGV